MNSYWLNSSNISERDKPIDNNYMADVCIIGAGIAGLSTGYYLAKNGLKVIILDKSEIGAKTSGHTTAKITAQHGLIYDYLINSFGLDFASKYYKSNIQAIKNIKQIIDSENIDCDFEYKNNYVYTSNQSELTKIHNEIKALTTIMDFLQETNFHNSSGFENNTTFPQFVTNCGLPFKTCGAVETKNQAQFHPLKFMYGLAKAIKNYSGLIFTNSLVKDIQKYDEGYICYTNEYIVKSKYVVVTSHYPFINFPGFYFSKMYQATSYAIAIEAKKNFPNGMYINSKEPTVSFRTAKYNDKDLLIIGGGGHKTGYSPDSDSDYGYTFLEKIAKQFYPDSNILYKWNTRDCITLDKVPYIGEFSIFMPDVYVATGFNKWGMTSSNVAANIIKDEILGIENPYSKIYNSSRFSPIKNRGEMKNMVTQVFHSFVSNRIKIPEDEIASIKNDNGGIIKINGVAIGIYKDKNGHIFAVNPTCTHLGCLLTWNNLDKTWDCPCHGSRFDYHGKNLYDPAFKDLEIYGNAHLEPGL